MREEQLPPGGSGAALSSAASHAFSSFPSFQRRLHSCLHERFSDQNQDLTSAASSSEPHTPRAFPTWALGVAGRPPPVRCILLQDAGVGSPSNCGLTRSSVGGVPELHVGLPPGTLGISQHGVRTGQLREQPLLTALHLFYNLIIQHIWHLTLEMRSILICVLVSPTSQPHTPALHPPSARDLVILPGCLQVGISFLILTQAFPTGSHLHLPSSALGTLQPPLCSPSRPQQALCARMRPLACLLHGPRRPCRSSSSGWPRKVKRVTLQESMKVCLDSEDGSLGN